MKRNNKYTNKFGINSSINDKNNVAKLIKKNNKKSEKNVNEYFYDGSAERAMQYMEEALKESAKSLFEKFNESINRMIEETISQYVAPTFEDLKDTLKNSYGYVLNKDNDFNFIRMKDDIIHTFISSMPRREYGFYDKKLIEELNSNNHRLLAVVDIEYESDYNDEEHIENLYIGHYDFDIIADLNSKDSDFAYEKEGYSCRIINSIYLVCNDDDDFNMFKLMNY